MIDLVHALARRHDVALTLWTRRHDGPRWRSSSSDAVPWRARPTADGPGGAAPVPAGLLPPTVRALAPTSRPVRLAWEQVRLPRVLRAASVAVHHGPHYTMPGRAPVPTVVTVHDLTFFDHPEWHERGKVPVFRRAIRVAARHAGCRRVRERAHGAAVRRAVLARRTRGGRPPRRRPRPVPRRRRRQRRRRTGTPGRAPAVRGLRGHARAAQGGARARRGVRRRR